MSSFLIYWCVTPQALPYLSGHKWGRSCSAHSNGVHWQVSGLQMCYIIYHYDCLIIVMSMTLGIIFNTKLQTGIKLPQ